ARWARKASSFSVSPEKMRTFASVLPGVTVGSGTVVIVPEHLYAQGGESSQARSAYLAASGKGITSEFARLLAAKFMVRHNSIPHHRRAVSSMNPVNPSSG